MKPYQLAVSKHYSGFALDSCYKIHVLVNYSFYKQSHFAIWVVGTNIFCFLKLWRQNVTKKKDKKN